MGEKISANCPACGHKVRVRVERANQEFPCPACAAPMEIPWDDAPAESAGRPKRKKKKKADPGGSVTHVCMDCGHRFRVATGTSPAGAVWLRVLWFFIYRAPERCPRCGRTTKNDPLFPPIAGLLAVPVGLYFALQWFAASAEIGGGQNQKADAQFFTLACPGFIVLLTLIFGGYCLLTLLSRVRPGRRRAGPPTMTTTSSRRRGA
jgi:hypothetical protein